MTELGRRAPAGDEAEGRCGSGVLDRNCITVDAFLASGFGPREIHLPCRMFTARTCAPVWRPHDRISDYRGNRIAWGSDLADIPEGSTMSTGISAKSSPWLVGQPHLCAATLGILLRGLGPERICRGTDALWTGSPQWQIEGLRRLEIPEETQKNMGSNHWGVERGR